MNFQVVDGNPAEPVSSAVDVAQKSSRPRRSRTSLGDKAFALVVLVTFSPVLALVSLLILLGGQKPIFFQERVGYKGALFCIFKFRTIPDRGWRVARRRAQGSPLMRLRLAIFERVSVVLRATGLDELPQFANIVNGDMQIIGPRPLIVEDFIALPEGRMGRCVVPPGITGFAQVNGGQRLDAESKLALDLYLIDHLSFGIVVKIVVRTILRILRGTAATARVCAVDLARAEEHAARKGRPLYESDAGPSSSGTSPLRWFAVAAPKRGYHGLEVPMPAAREIKDGPFSAVETH